MGKQRLELEWLGERIVPATTVWWGTVSTDFGIAENWSNGVPGPNDDPVFNNTAVRNCLCGLSSSWNPGTGDWNPILHSVTLTSTFTRELHFTASSGTTVDIGAGGITQHHGGIEQDNGCTIESDGGAVMDGGDMNDTTSTLGNIVVKKNTTWDVEKYAAAPAPSVKLGDTYSVYSGATLHLDCHTNDGSKLPIDIVFTKGSALVLTDGARLKWDDGNLGRSPTASVAVLTNNGGVVNFYGNSRGTDDTVWTSCELPYVQGPSTDGSNSAWGSRVNSQITFLKTSGSYAFDATSGFVYMYDSSKISVKDSTGDMHIGCDYYQYTTATLATGTQKVVVDAGNFYVGYDSSLLRSAVGTLTTDKIEFKGTMTLQVGVDVHAVTCSVVKATSATLDCTNATIKATTYDLQGGTVPGGTWAVIDCGTTGTLTVTNDFGTKTLPFNDGTGGNFTASAAPREYHLISGGAGPSKRR
jgi:hypothetical protein